MHTFFSGREGKRVSRDVKCDPLIPPLLSDGMSACVVLYRRISIPGLFAVAKRRVCLASWHRAIGIMFILGQFFYQIIYCSKVKEWHEEILIIYAVSGMGRGYAAV